MILPRGMTESEVLSDIEYICNGLAYKFLFEPNTVEDMKQYARLFAIEAVDKYDSSRNCTLRTFLWTHVRNRLYSLKRDNYERPNKPCNNCPLMAYDPQHLKSKSDCTAYSDKMECSHYYRWFNRTTTKKNIISPIEIGNVQDEQESNMKVFDDIGESIDLKHIIELVDKSVPINLRSMWIKLKTGISLNKGETDKLIPAVKEILRNNGIEHEP